MQANDTYTQSLRQVAQTFQNALRTSGMLSGSYVDELDQKLNQEFYALLQSTKPKIMVYGIYNSGKSTLVNALCGQAVAEVADRPMTWRVAEYDAGKYILIDSPGVDAPIKHEEIADSQLGKCHVILFVMSSQGGFESRANYEKMLSLIQMDIPFYIILNDRGTVLPKDRDKRRQAQMQHTAELNEMKRKIIRNLITYSGNEGIGDQYEIIDLNAKRAWLGIEQNKPGLMENSKVPILRARLERLLEEKGAMEWLKAPLATLDSCIANAESEIMARQGKTDYANKRESLQAKLESSRGSLQSKIRNCVYSRQEEAYNLLLSGGAVDGLESDIVQEAQNVCQEEYRRLSNDISAKLPDVSALIKAGARAREAAANVPGFPPANGGGTQSPVIGIGSAGQAHGNQIMNFTSAIAKCSDVSSGGMDILPLLKRLPELLKSRAKKEQEEYERLCEQAEINNRAIADRVAEESRRRQDARIRAYAYLDGLWRKFQQLVLADIDSQFQMVLDNMDAAIQTQEQMDSAARQLLETLQGLRRNLIGLRTQIM